MAASSETPASTGTSAPKTKLPKLSTTERVMKNVPQPRAAPLEKEKLWAAPGKPNTVELKEHLFYEGRLHKDDVLEIIRSATKIMRKEPNLLEVDAPITGTFVLAARLFSHN